MRVGTLQVLILMAGCAILLSLPGAAQEPGKPVFAAPKRIQAGTAILGQGRLYPSPVFHDVNGDKVLDIVVGDLIGKVTVAHGVVSDGGLRFGAEKALMGRDGKPLKFHNW